MTKFSIIIPEYNSGKKILSAIKSLERQSFNDFEVIIVDDCSTDNSYDEIAEYFNESNLNVKLIRAEKNSGPGVVRNIGIQNATGTYICFMDADDYITEDYFESLNAAISVDNDIDLIYFGNYHIIGSKRREFFPKHYNSIDEFVARASGALWSFCFRKQLIERFPMPPIRNAEDIAIIPLCIMSANHIVYCDKALYYYINNIGSLSNTHSPNVTYNFVRSFEFTLSHLKAPYSSGVEFHGIKTILYGAVLNGMKARISWIELKKLISNFERDFPNWYNNIYINSYSFRKRFFLTLVKDRKQFLLRTYVSVHNFLLKYL